MLNLSELPKDPIEALKAALIHIISISRGNASYSILKKNNNPIVKDLIIAFAVVKRCAETISDDEIKYVVLSCTIDNNDLSLDTISLNAETALSAVIALKLDNHFLNNEDVETFDFAELDADDKAQIRELMSKARRVLDTTQVLPDWQKRKVQHHISKIENELYKERSDFQTFLAASGDVLGLVGIFGKELQPVADAIQTARTVTEKKIQGYEKLTAEEPPKQLPKPSKSSASNE